MKNLSTIILAGLTAGWFGVAATAVAQTTITTTVMPSADQPATTATVTTTAQTPDQPATAATAATEQTNTAAATAMDTNTTGAESTHSAATAGVADKGATLNIHGFTVDQTLNYLASAAGYTIIRKADTHNTQGTVDVTSLQPLSTNELVALLNKVLADSELTAIQDGKTLTIETTEMATTSAGTQINVWNGDYTSVPQDSAVGTYIILLHSLNPTEVLKDLLPMRPADATMLPNPGGNAIIMTGRNSDVRHFAQIISALDSSGNGDLEVFLLNYADSKSIAQELKDVFSPTDTANGQQGGNPFAFFGGRGARGGGGGGGAAAEDNPKRAAIHVNAVSDDENNAVLVSAPVDIMPGISNLIVKLDIPQEDTIEIRVFSLRHADPTDIVTELTTLFPDPNGTTTQQNGNARGQVARFGGGGARGGFGGGGGGGAAGGSMSDRMKKQVTVTAVADARTQSVLVTASKDTMGEIEKMIDDLDENPARGMQVYVFRPMNGDVTDMQGPLQDLFGSTTSRSTATTTAALTQRAQQAAQNGGTLSSSSLNSSGLGGGGGGGGTGGLRQSN